jgi:DNA polymerase II large subunit
MNSDLKVKNYFDNLNRSVHQVYDIAKTARTKGFDPKDKVEIPLAMSMAEKCVGLIGTIYPQIMDCGVSERILDLEKEYGKLDPAVCLQIAEEVAKQKFCQFKDLMEAIDAGARLGFAYITLGVVSSPIEGLTEIKIGKTRDGKEYFSPWYAGPVRSAGGTGSAFSLVIIDYLREIFGYAKYDPSEDEIKRTVTEINDYHERITNLQYFPLEEEAAFLARHVPLQVNGDPSEKMEVSNYKNLERIETNNIRSGVCLTLAEGLAQKAPKIKRYIKSLREKGFKLSDWDFLDEYIELHEKLTSGKSKGAGDSVPTYIKDLVAGRPIYGHPSRSGGFRYRYGRGRTSGFSAASLHPATMAISDNFIAIGTQLKIEKPTKGCAVTTCDKIEGPIIKLFNGSVKQIKNVDEAKKLYKDVEEIIYLGDILFPFSDLANRNYGLIKPGFVEEWWWLELKEEGYKGDLDFWNVSFEESLTLSNKYNIPLYPKFIFYWTQIEKKHYNNLIDWIKDGQIRGGKLVLNYHKSDCEKYSDGKRALELLGVEHDVSLENVVISKKNSQSLFVNLGLDLSFLDVDDLVLSDLINEENMKLSDDKKILEKINELSDFEIKDKAGEFIGTRMGRPEKAKLRKLTGSPNVLFSVGNEGGRLRSVIEACNVGKVRSSFPLFFCEKCSNKTIYPWCEKCRSKCEKRYYYRSDGEIRNEKEYGEEKGSFTMNKDIDIKYYFDDAVKKMGLSKEEIPSLLKGVRGMSSENKIPEYLGKGILRAKYGLQVNKDGTIRYDVTELPVVAFKPKEVGVSIDKLKEIGYNEDIYGKSLEDEEQILELMPHDILLPCAPDSPDETADIVFVRATQFMDEMLVKIYGMEPFYNVKKREDLVGKLSVCMAPHNCAGVISRIVGFTKMQGLVASPYMHAAMRRDCDGDEAAIMLLGDVLINFSREFLPSHRGGTQDAPLVLNAKIEAGEVDDQILDFELVGESFSYPLELYKKAEQKLHSSEVSGIKNVKKALKMGETPFIGVGFTHDTYNFNDGVSCSAYKLLGTMQEKVQHQMELVERIRAVDTSDTARLIIERHFIRDMRGNLRKFSMQGFRCVACNEIMRRPPLNGVCPACKGKIIFTIHEGGIKKYLQPAMDLIEKYRLSPYIKQSMELTKRQIDSIFGKELEKQENLKQWF